MMSEYRSRVTNIVNNRGDEYKKGLMNTFDGVNYEINYFQQTQYSYNNLIPMMK